MLSHPSETLCHYWECQGYHTGQLGGKKMREWEGERLVHLNEFQLYGYGYLSESVRKCQSAEIKSKCPPTFTEGLHAGPGPIREAHPLWGTNQIVALRAAEVNLGADPEIRLFPRSMGRNARVAAGTSCVACREKEQGNRMRSQISTLEYLNHQKPAASSECTSNFRMTFKSLCRQVIAL